MLKDRIVVLKFGGSVLTDLGAFERVTDEIRRWRREGWRVVGVVSALAGKTDELANRCAMCVQGIDAHTHAGMLALGERESAALLALRLADAGIGCASLTPGGVGLLASGDPLDAIPFALRTEAILRVLDDVGVVVFPGFVALDTDGRTVTLGRGGSDLTALFLADRLDAEACRLVKDVDALYERDPTLAGPPARRYRRATYGDALATDGSIVQHKAVKFAQERRVVFELGALGAERPTQIGGNRSVLEHAETGTVLA